MKRVMAFVVTVAMSASFVACGGVPGTGGGDSGGSPTPAMTPVMYCLDHYQAGQMVKYKMTPGDMETTIKCVGVDGDNLWIETTMAVSGTENTHLLLVEKASGKVVKAWWSGKDSKDWKETTLMEIPTTSGEATKECPACKKTHKEGSTTWGADSFKVGDKDVATSKCDQVYYACDGTEGKMSTQYSTDVPMLYCMKGQPMDKGGLCCMDMGSSKNCLTEFKAEGAEPKHKLPENK